MSKTTMRHAFKVLPTCAVIALSVALAVSAFGQDAGGNAGPVGAYQIAAASAGDSAHVYKLDTRTGQLCECGQVVFTLNPTVIGSGCLEVQQSFAPLKK